MVEWASRFNGLPVAKKPLKRFSFSFPNNTGLKPGVNESETPGKNLNKK
jgi:hypothetical protein